PRSHRPKPPGFPPKDSVRRRPELHRPFFRTRVGGGSAPGEARPDLLTGGSQDPVAAPRSRYEPADLGPTPLEVPGTRDLGERAIRPGLHRPVRADTRGRSKSPSSSWNGSAAPKSLVAGHCKASAGSCDASPNSRKRASVSQPKKRMLPLGKT